MSRRAKPVEVKSVVTDPKLVERRRQQIVRAATKLFSSKGYHETTVKDIADSAGISAGLIYQYVEEKYDILFLAIMESIHEKRREIPKAFASSDDPVRRFIAVVEAYVRIHDSHRQAVILTYREITALPRKHIEELKRIENSTNDLIAEAVTECIRTRLFRDVNADFIAHQVVVFAQSWATKYWRLGTKMGLEEYSLAFVDLLLNALLTDKGRRQTAWFFGTRATPVASSVRT